MTCTKCGGTCTKKGKQNNGVQKYYCKPCNKWLQALYTQNARKVNCATMVVKLLLNGCGIRGTARVLEISPVTVLNIIKQTAKSIIPPSPIATGKTYELDELKTFFGNKRKECWVALAMQVETRQIIAMRIGSRSISNMKPLIQTVTNSNPLRVMTDGLEIYQKLLHPAIHIRKGHCTNHIERFNLSLRNMLKRLGRKTLCYSKSAFILECCVRIGCWGNGFNG